MNGYIFCCDEEQVGKINITKSSLDSSLEKCSHIKNKLDSGESLTAHYLDSKLVKITVNDNKKGLNKNYEIYFNNDTLIYIYEVKKKYLPSGLRKELNYFYFKDNKMICWKKNDLTPSTEDEAYYSTERNLLAKVEKYLTELQ